MAVDRVKIVNPNGKVGYVAATYPPYVHGRLKPAPSERDRRRRAEAPPATTEPQQPAEASGDVNEES